MTGALAGPDRTVDGADQGWRRDGDGALAAAVAAVRLTGRIATAGFITRSDLITSLATEDYGPTLVSASSGQLAEMTAELGSVGVPPGALLWEEFPLTARVVTVDNELAEVEVWAVLVVGVPNVGAPRQVWRTVTVTLAWERGGWRIDGWATRPGPTPALAAASAVSDVAAVAEVSAWPATSGGGG